MNEGKQPDPSQLEPWRVKMIIVIGCFGAGIAVLVLIVSLIRN